MINFNVMKEPTIENYFGTVKGLVLRSVLVPDRGLVRNFRSPVADKLAGDVNFFGLGRRLLCKLEVNP